MSEVKLITTRIPNVLLETIDELVPTKFDNRSDAVRGLLELGIDKNNVIERVERIEAKLDRLLHVSESLFKYCHVNLLIQLNVGDSVSIAKMNQYMPGFKDEANRALAEMLIDKFGE